MEIGPVGDGIYWCLVEMLYEENGYLPLSDCYLIAKALNTTEELVTKVVKNAKLFLVKDEKFYSESLLSRLKKITTKIKKARTSGKLGGLAKAKRTLSERLVSKESKESKESKFEEIYLKYPNKVGKKGALRHFELSVKTEQDWQDIQTALKNYLVSERVAKGFIMNASTFFNNWRDWINYKEVGKFIKP